MLRVTRFVGVVVLLVLMVSAAYAEGKTTVDPNTIPKPVKAPPVELKDDRLDQKIEYDGGNARLHDVAAGLGKMSGVTIYCGSAPDDWRVRDIPVTVAARGMPLRELLDYICWVTHTSLTKKKTGKGQIVYRIVADADVQRAYADYDQAVEDYEKARMAWDLEVASRLKDIPVSEIKPPPGASDDWWDRMTRRIEASKLLAAMDQKMKDAILSGEPILLTPGTAPANLREPLLGLFKAWDASELDRARKITYSSEGGKGYTPPSIELAPPGALEAAQMRIALNRSRPDGWYIFIEGSRRDDISEGKGNESYELPDEMAVAVTTYGKGFLNLPKEPQYPERPSDKLPIGNMKPIRDVPDLPEKVTIKTEDDKQPLHIADALLALSKATGLTIVCEDFESHREKDLKNLLGKEMPFRNALLQTVNLNWVVDTKAGALAGFAEFWRSEHENLLPESLIDNLTAKANGDGVDLDDLAGLADYSLEAIADWLPQRTLPHISYPCAQPAYKAMWAFYNSLGASDKALVKSETGLPLAKFDMRPIMEWLNDRVHNDRSFIGYLSNTAMEKRFLSPAVLPTLVMRIDRAAVAPRSAPRSAVAKPAPEETKSAAPVKIPPGYPNRYDYMMYIEGTDSTGRASVSFDGGYSLPCFAPERETVLAEALRKQTETKKAEQPAEK